MSKSKNLLGVVAAGALALSACGADNPEVDPQDDVPVESADTTLAEGTTVTTIDAAEPEPEFTVTTAEEEVVTTTVTTEATTTTTVEDVVTTVEPSPDPTDISVYIGLSQADAAALAIANGTTSRTERIDDETFGLTSDFVGDRVNFEVDDGIVTSAKFG